HLCTLWPLWVHPRSIPQLTGSDQHMPNILPVSRNAVADRTANGAYLLLTLDDLRRDPGRLVFLRELAFMGIVRSYDAVQRLVSSGRLPPPYRIGIRLAWEARDILGMLGADRRRQVAATPCSAPKIGTLSGT